MIRAAILIVIYVAISILLLFLLDKITNSLIRIVIYVAIFLIYTQIWVTYNGVRR
jgi:hypothetical protein